MREREVEKYLKTEVRKAGGTTRKWVSPGHKNVPDQIVIWPTLWNTVATIHFIETKAPKKDASEAQAREHNRLRKFSCFVTVLNTKEKVDNYVREWK